MERGTNYLAVGAFGLVLIFGMFVAVLWLAGAQFRLEYQEYATSFEGPVSGLGTGAAVRLNGLDVGRVKSLTLDDKDPRLVLAILQIRSGVTIREDAVASLETQGLTGVSYVELSGGSASAGPLVAKGDEPLPVIRSRPSSIQQLVSNAPEVLARLLVVADRLVLLLDADNRSAIAGTLANLQETTAVIRKRGAEIDQVIVDGAATTHTLAGTMVTLDAAMKDMRQSLGKIDHLVDRLDETVVTANDSVKKFGQVAIDVDGVVTGSRTQIRDFTATSLPQITQLISEARTLVTSLTRTANELEHDPSGFLFGDRRRGFTPR